MSVEPVARNPRAVAEAALSFWSTGDHSAFMHAYEETDMTTNEWKQTFKEAESLADDLVGIIAGHVTLRRRR